MEQYFDSEAAGKHLGIPKQTLHNWRSQGKGPRYLKIGRHVRYRVSDLDAWAAKQVVRTVQRRAAAG